MSTTTFLNKLKYAHIYFPVIILLWIGLYLDSAFVAARFPVGQWIASILVVICFFWIFRHASKTMRQMMLYGLIVATFGEMLFSIVLGMYSYRLGTIPVYIPFGHMLLYASISYLIREPLIHKNKKQILNVLYPAIFIYSFLWLIFAHDLFGFCSTLVLYLVVLRLKYVDPLFFLLLFLIIINVELVGTSFQCWKWPPIWFNRLEWMPSANPPSGIGTFYFLIEVLSLLMFKYANMKRWKRFRTMREARVYLKI